jgi:hypothetical protein
MTVASRARDVARVIDDDQDGCGDGDEMKKGL